MEQLKSLQDILTHFKEESVCLEFLEQMRWNGKPVCPHCKAHRPYKLKDGKTYRCSSRFCRKDFTVLVGSIMENTKLPLSKWLACIYIATAHKKGISSCQLARDLNLTQKSAWFLMHRVREMVKPKSDTTLSDTVQIDETYVKGKAKNRSKYKRKLIAEGVIKDDATVVLGLVQSNGSVVLKVVPNAETATLKPVINAIVPNSDTVIVTDGHVSYPAIGAEYKQHEVVNHSEYEYLSASGFHTNTIEGAFSHFKRAIYGTYHFITSKHCQRYADLFSYRYSTRKIKDAQRFFEAMKQTEGRLKYKKLIEKL
ncbi:MAG TPA: IS1595 family transposase [Panacibacter sp.]|nr:IS1595 family transposase [Panacibacter sp.]